MLRAALSRMWEQQKIYHTQAYREIWVGIIITGFVFYKISSAAKNPGKKDTKSIGHH